MSQLVDLLFRIPWHTFGCKKVIFFHKKLNNLLPQQALLTIYKSLVIPHLDYGNIIYNQPINESIKCMLLSSQVQ